MDFNTVMTQVATFNTEAMAQSYASRQANRWIVLGDNGQYWVTTYRYAMKLVAFGYELLSK